MEKKGIQNMENKQEKRRNFLSLLPTRVRAELERLTLSRGSDITSVSEIKLRAFGRSTVTVSGEKIALASRVGCEEMSEILSLLCEGSLYAYRDRIREGYISLDGGVRVGICAEARYDSGNLVGVTDVTSLVFRIPTGSFSFAPELYEIFRECSRGMLIYSPPGVGKTTALRSLVGLIGSGRRGEEVSVIDERCEFFHDDYVGASVDILRGYKRADGMEIALRSLSPEVIAVDEVGRLSEANAMLESLNAGVRVIATAHADSLDALKRRVNMKPFFDYGVFDVFVGIKKRGDVREITVERAEDERCFCT